MVSPNASMTICRERWAMASAALAGGTGWTGWLSSAAWAARWR